MDIAKFAPDSPGHLVEITGYPGATHAFVPDPLPARWQWPAELWPLLVAAHQELARLDGVGKHLPNPRLLLTPIQNREAQRSSSLEGTFATGEQMALFEMAPGDPALGPDAAQAAREIANYSRALRFRAETQEQLPVSLRLIRDLHRILLTGVRGANTVPGEFRRGQVQIGQPARFIPPPAQLVAQCLDHFEKYLHASKNHDPLVEAFLVHYQFEAIHPFADGNGRVGRLLLGITIQDWCGLSNQWLYMSAYFDAHRDEYIDRLFRVSTDGDWQGWMEFCLKGVVEQATDSQQRCSRLLALRDAYREKVSRKKAVGRLVPLVEGLFISPVATATTVIKRYGVSHPTARTDLDTLVELGILKETKLKRRRQKGYLAPEILAITYEGGT